MRVPDPVPMAKPGPEFEVDPNNLFCGDIQAFIPEGFLLGMTTRSQVALLFMVAQVSRPVESWTGDPKQQAKAAFDKAGDIYTMCNKPFEESYGYPLACEGCGGDGVLEEGYF